MGIVGRPTKQSSEAVSCGEVNHLIFQNRRSNKGFTIIDSLIATVIVITGFLAVTTTMRGAFQISLKSRLIARQVALESAIISGLQDPANFSTTVRASLGAGNPPAAFTISDSNSVVIAQIGRTLFFTPEGTSCPALSINNRCLLSVRLDINCRGSGLCFAAYQIAVAQLGQNLSISALGSPNFAAADYALPLPYDLYLGKQIQGVCDPNTELAVNGLNRQTGTLTCIRKPALTTACADRRLASRLIYNNINRSIEMQCRPAGRTLTCPTNYALWNFNPASLDTSTPTGRCVFIGANTTGQWPNPPAPALSVSGTFCPSHYRTVPSCTLVSQVISNVSCPTCLSCSGVFPLVTCVTVGGEFLRANIGSCSTTSSNQIATGRVVFPAQPSCRCGGASPSWTALVRLRGTCSLIDPVEVNAL